MPATPIDVAKSFSDTIKEITALLREWIAGANIRQMKAAIEAGEKYIRISMPILEGSLKDSKELKELKGLEERFFKYN